MATQLAPTNDTGPGKKVVVQTGAKLAAFIPQTLEEAWRLAGALAASGMTPKSYGQDQNKIMVGMMAGAEVGLTPMAALQSIAVIGNNPSLWGDGALGLIQASGLLEDMDETDDGETATCTLKRKGRATPIVKSFSMDDAKRAGLAGKAGPWTQYPSRMRQMRARAFAMRDGFADVLRGLHILEEARDYAPMIDAGTLNRQPLTGAALLQQALPEPDNEIPPATAAGTAEGETSEDDAAPSSQEGKPEEERGEKPEVAEAIGFVKRAELVADVNNLVRSYQGEFSEADMDELKSAATARIAELKGEG